MSIWWFSFLKLEIIDLHIKKLSPDHYKFESVGIIADATMLMNNLEKSLSAKLPMSLSHTNFN
jgi:hypothetical protein